jgi:hypothetical protein
MFSPNVLNAHDFVLDGERRFDVAVAQKAAIGRTRKFALKNLAENGIPFPESETAARF